MFSNWQRPVAGLKRPGSSFSHESMKMQSRPTWAIPKLPSVLLRHQLTLAPCRSGVHPIGWTVEADTKTGELRSLPPYVAARTVVAYVNEVEVT